MFKIKLEEGAIFKSNNDSDSGYDICALGYKRIKSNNTLDELKSLKEKGYVIIKPHETILITTGVYLQLPKPKDNGDCISIIEAQIRPRSGISLKENKVAILGTVDNSYRNMLGVILNNSGNKEIRINYQDRIAQVVFVPIIKPKEIKIVENINSDTERGLNGFGSSGNN